MNEELRKLYPIKLNQNFVCKKNKVTRAIASYKEENDGKMPSNTEISSITKLSPRVVQNVLDINGGENFSYVSFQAVSSNNKSDDSFEIETKLVQEYLDTVEPDYGISSYEFKDMISALKKNTDREEFNIFIDKHMHNISVSDLVKKYKCPATAINQKLKCVESKCKQLVGEF